MSASNEESGKDKKFYFSASTRNMRLGDYQFDHRGLLVVDSEKEADKVKALLEAFGRGVTGPVSYLGDYNPYESIVEPATSIQGATQTSQRVVDDTKLTPAIAEVETGDSKPVVVGEIKQAASPIVNLATPKPAAGLPPLSTLNTEDKDKAGV